MEQVHQLTGSEDLDLANSIPLQIRDARGEEIIHQHMLGAMGLGLLPFPAIDAMAITGVQVNMLRSLATLHGVEFANIQIFYSIVGSLTAGLGLPLALAPAVVSIFKVVPGLGTLGGLVSMPLVAGATTYALGRVFAQHFESGGTLLTFDALKVRRSLRTYYEQGLQRARELRVTSVPATAAAEEVATAATPTAPSHSVEPSREAPVLPVARVEGASASSSPAQPTAAQPTPAQPTAAQELSALLPVMAAGAMLVTPAERSAQELDQEIQQALEGLLPGADDPLEAVDPVSPADDTL